ISGTEGQRYRLEGIEIESDLADVGVEYRTHVQNIGWQDWRSDGEMSGTEGLSYRLESIEIKLTGAKAESFDIYYQVHAQNYGWLDWAKNGDSAGTAGKGLRLEAIRIVVVPAGSAAPGPTAQPFIS
ncbi:MAG: serine protease, partial [Acetobacterium sp.]|nr:serine protease [Acetobacterium sp.]